MSPPISSAAVAPARRPRLLPAALLRLVSDERLVEQMRAGSEHAFEALFARHHGRLLAFCRHMLRSNEDAEDVVQQTFLAAYCDLLRSDKPIAPRPWLFTIARNRCISILRAERERAVDAAPPVADNLFAEVDRREDLRGLLADLVKLPDDQRAALLLTEVSGVPQDEIADILGCRPERVKALVFRARSSLAAERAARETPCYEIRTQLATLRGGALRRAVLRRHVRTCAGCREFQAKVRLQRRQFGALLPAGPSLGLGLPGFLTGSGAAGIGGVTLSAGALGGGVVARVLVGAALSSGGAVAGVTAIAHSGAAPGVSAAAPAARAEADVEQVRHAREPVRGPALAEQHVVPWRAGGTLSGERAAGIQPRLRTAEPAVTGSLPEPAAGQDPASDSEHLPAATGGDGPVVELVAELQPDPGETAADSDQQASSGPPEPSSPAGSGATGGTPPATGGSGPPATAGASPHPNGPAGDGLSPSAGGAGAPHRPPRAAGRPPEAAPHNNAPKPPAGPASNAEPGNGPPRHAPLEAAAEHTKPDSGGPPKPPSPAASNPDAGPPPAAGVSPGGPAHSTGGKHAPGTAR